jgi:hypothetical protein
MSEPETSARANTGEGHASELFDVQMPETGARANTGGDGHASKHRRRAREQTPAKTGARANTGDGRASELFDV